MQQTLLFRAAGARDNLLEQAKEARDSVSLKETERGHYAIPILGCVAGVKPKEVKPQVDEVHVSVCAATTGTSDNSRDCDTPSQAFPGDVDGTHGHRGRDHEHGCRGSVAIGHQDDTADAGPVVGTDTRAGVPRGDNEPAREAAGQSRRSRRRRAKRANQRQRDPGDREIREKAGVMKTFAQIYVTTSKPNAKGQSSSTPMMRLRLYIACRDQLKEGRVKLDSQLDVTTVNFDPPFIDPKKMAQTPLKLTAKAKSVPKKEPKQANKQAAASSSGYESWEKVDGPQERVNHNLKAMKEKIMNQMHALQAQLENLEDLEELERETTSRRARSRYEPR